MPADMIFCSRTIIWATSLLGTAAAIVASVYWLDRPIASVMHSYSFRNSHQQAVEGLSHFPNPVILLAVVLSAILGLRIALGRRLSRNQANTFVCSLAVLFTETTKDGLKFFSDARGPKLGWTIILPLFAMAFMASIFCTAAMDISHFRRVIWRQRALLSRCCGFTIRVSGAFM